MRNGVSSFLATHTQYLIICESQVAVIPNFCRFHYFEPKCQYFSYGWWYFCFPTWETYLLKQTLKRGMNTSVTNKKKKNASANGWPLINIMALQNSRCMEWWWSMSRRKSYCPARDCGHLCLFPQIHLKAGYAKQILRLGWRYNPNWKLWNQTFQCKIEIVSDPRIRWRRIRRRRSATISIPSYMKLLKP